ncbi:MAG: sulfur carrier protein ThiS adenylyltransferase ThiF [Bacteroidetes bacterium]|nr:sulfur carrier protein ThiS adenylyltransferase ThiF [Bacteroidota bacterium]MBU1579428.1 sulfur carrier protein ThiS adenylyltransferase ThiF [Bacteroidota bacterium]MBU2557756.1 sulfur carrier protein ThiS adenylyltransferase ThiF [Bacteroidota bacterium]
MKEKDIRQLLKSCRVGVAGCGGLGSNAAVALARIGIGGLELVDFDKVEASNLNRQYFFKKQLGLPKVEALAQNIHSIDPDVKLNCHQTKLDKDNISAIFSSCDLIIEAFDRAEAKAMLLEFMLEHMPQIPLIMGNGMAGFGGFDKLRQVQWDKHVYICGDFEAEIAEDLPPLAPRVGIVANMQANLALELLIKKG